MIEAKEGMVTIKGSSAEVMADLTSIIKSVHSVFAKAYDDEFARKAIVECGRLAYTSADCIVKGYMEECKE